MSNVKSVSPGRAIKAPPAASVVGTMARVAEEGLHPVAKAKATNNEAGYQAQGWALAQRVIAVTRSTARDLARIAREGFTLSPLALTFAVKTLGEDLKTATMAAATTMGLSEKEAASMARSASSYASQMRMIFKAQAAGMTPDTLAALIFKDYDPATHDLAPDWLDHVGLASMYQAARTFTNAEANEGRGRPKAPWTLQLAKWLAEHQPPVADLPAEVIAALDMLAPVLDEALAAEEKAKADRKAKRKGGV